jgi:hypothetical protein
MTGTFSRKVAVLALAFAFALAVFAFAFAFRVPRRWWYVFGASGTRAIRLIMADSFAVGANCSP